MLPDASDVPGRSSRSRAGRSEGTGWGKWAAVGALVLVAALFSFLNSRERVTVDVGVTVLYQVSLVGLIFGAFLLGMISMFLFGIRYDRRVRDVLRGRTALPPRDEFIPPRPPPEPPP